MTESKAGFELISGPSSGGPGTVEDLLRAENPLKRLEQFQAWMLRELTSDDQKLMTELFLFGTDKVNLVALPGILSADSFPIKLIKRFTHSQTLGVETGDEGIYLDHLVPQGNEGRVVPYLAIRFNSLSFTAQRESPSDIRDSSGFWREAGLNSLLDLGLPLDVALWQVTDHPGKFSGRRVDHLMGMRPIVYINGQSQMETATEDELLKLPGVIMRVNGVTRFYVADPEYEIAYEEE